MCGLFPTDNSMYGHKVKSKFFQGKDFKNFNHGSFGAVPREVKAAQDKLFEESEDHPDRWFREGYYKHIKAARQCVASLINANLEDTVLVENASTAINSVIRSLPWKRGDKVLVLSTAYPMVIHTFKWLVQTQGIEIVTVQVDFPCEDKRQVLDAVSAALEMHDNIKLCVFSHITSIPALILPVDELVAICRVCDRNPSTLVLIDGAHAPGCIDINVQSINADYYTGNLHKWCFTPKGCAFLWTTPLRQGYDILEPTVISATGLQGYEDRYAYTGTRDYTSFATIPAAFVFCRAMGGCKSIYEYNNNLIIEGAQLCARKWGTQLLSPKNMLSTMADVILPCNDPIRCKIMTDTLQSRYNTFIIARDWKLTGAHGLAYIAGEDDKDGSNGKVVQITRLSAQIYLEIGDFATLADRVLELLRETVPVHPSLHHVQEERSEN